MLELKQVVKSYIEPNGELLPILNIARFDVDAGEQVVLMGQSGSGKTTLLHIIAGISLADSGSVVVAGKNISKMPEAARDRFRADNIGYVFQTFNLLPGFSALENVMLGMAFAKGAVDRDRAKALLERVGLGGRLTHKPPQLSVGEQQRVSVARALANRPRLLLADEPTANVDPGHQQQIVDMLRQRCQEENVSLVLVTHTPEVASQFERVVRLEEINQR